MTEKIEMTAEERQFIDRFTASYCRPHAVVVAERLAAFVAARQNALLVGRLGSFALAAGVAAPAPRVEAPEEEVRFVFASDGAADAPESWRAELTVPPRAGSDTMLALRVRDGAGAAAEGLFRLAGVSLPLVGGTAEIPFGQFLAGIKNTDVSLTRPAGPAVAGRLLFF